MDGPWQMNHRTAYEYGRVANEIARGMKTFDASLELVACGSSHMNMPTYPDWEREVLTECYDNVDYISLHTYWQNYERDPLNFLAKSVLLDRYIGTVSGIIDYVKAKKRSKHDVYISFDEWNVWYHSRKADGSNDNGRMPAGGRHRRSWRTFTTSRTFCWSAVRSTPSSATRTACASPALRSSST